MNFAVIHEETIDYCFLEVAIQWNC